LYDKAKAKAIPKNYIPFQDFLKKIGVSEDNFKEYRSNRKGVYGDLQKRINDLFVKKNFKKEVFYKDPSEKNINLFKKAISENKAESISKMARTKQSVSDKPIQAIHRELILDPDATPEELARNIYGKTDAKVFKKYL
jgi:predicted nuclease with TOPRIM domain